MSAARPTSSAPIVSAKGVVAAPPEVAMRNTCAMVGTSSSMPGTRCARSTMRISCSMSRSSLMPASSRPIAVLMPFASNTFSAATPERRRKLDEQLWQMQVAVAATVSMSAPFIHTAGPRAQPHAVAQRHLRTQQAEAFDVVHGGAAAAAARVFLLIRGLHQMHVQRHVEALRHLGEPRKCCIRAPVQIGRRELDLHAAL